MRWCPVPKLQTVRRMGQKGPCDRFEKKKAGVGSAIAVLMAAGWTTHSDVKRFNCRILDILVAQAVDERHHVAAPARDMQRDAKPPVLHPKGVT